MKNSDDDTLWFRHLFLFSSNQLPSIKFILILEKIKADGNNFR